jgi:PCI domain
VARLYCHYYCLLLCLQNLKGTFLLDVYLHSHVTALYSAIADACYVQYLSPFTAVRLDSVAAAFGTTAAAAEASAAALIKAGRIAARIDSAAGTLHSRSISKSSAAKAAVLRAVQESQRELQQMLLRMSCTEHDFAVKVSCL